MQDLGKSLLNKALATNITCIIIVIFPTESVLQKSVLISFQTVWVKKGITFAGVFSRTVVLWSLIAVYKEISEQLPPVLTSRKAFLMFCVEIFSKPV